MSAGKEWQGAAVRRGPVFDLPPFPESQSVVRGDLVRIVDPAGLAVAWVDPVSARCVEFMVRSSYRDRTVWRSVFAIPDAQETDTGVVGCCVLAVTGDPGSRTLLAKAAYDWSGAAWRLLQRDPTSVILQATLPDEESADVGKVYARLVVQLDDGTLSLSLTVHNDGAVALPVAFGFRGMLPHGLDFEPAVAPVVTTDRAGASLVGVTCDAGVHCLNPGAARGAGTLSLAMLGAPPGPPVVVLPGAQERMAISLSMFPDAEGSAEIHRSPAQVDAPGAGCHLEQVAPSRDTLER